MSAQINALTNLDTNLFISFLPAYKSRDTHRERLD